MRTFMWVAAAVLALGGLAFLLLGLIDEDGSPFGYSAVVKRGEGVPLACGVAYMGQTPDKSHAYKVEVSTTLLEGKYTVLAMQVSALQITEPEAMSGDWAKVESARLISKGRGTESLSRPSGEETNDYIAVATDPGELVALPLDMLEGSELELGLAGQPALSLLLPRADDVVADDVIQCFDEMKAALESAPAQGSANGT